MSHPLERFIVGIYNEDKFEMMIKQFDEWISNAKLENISPLCMSTRPRLARQLTSDKYTHAIYVLKDLAIDRAKPVQDRKYNLWHPTGEYDASDVSNLYIICYEDGRDGVRVMYCSKTHGEFWEIYLDKKTAYRVTMY
jgi:hypothetical protein